MPAFLAGVEVRRLLAGERLSIMKENTTYQK
jgi:hypothetical protein